MLTFTGMHQIETWFAYTDHKIYITKCTALTSLYQLHVRGFLKKFLHFNIFKENGKSRRGGGTVGCRVTCQQGTPVDLAVGTRVVMKQ
jgi:hypothetical protein